MEEIKLYSLSTNIALKLDDKLRIVRAMPDDGNFFGFSKKTMQHKLFTWFLDTENTKTFNKTIAKVKLNKIEHTELTIPHKNKKPEWYKVSITLRKIDKQNSYIVYCNNINELKNELLIHRETIEQLKQANTLHQQIIHNTQAIILRLDAHQNIIELSKGAEQVFGYTAESLLGKKWFEKMVPPRKFPEFKKGFIAFLKSTKNTRLIVAPIICSDGSIRTISWKTNKLFAQGHFIGTIAIGKDMTDINKQVNLLQQSEQRFRNLAELVPIPISFIKTDGKIVFLNDAYTKQFGYKLNDIPTVSSLLKISYTNRSERNIAFSYWKQDLEATKKNLFIPTRELVVYNKKKQKRIVRYTATVHQQHIHYAYVDITTQKEKEALLEEGKEAFRRIAEHTPIAVAGCHYQSYRLTFSNHKFYEIFGFHSQEIKHFKNWYQYIIYNNSKEKKLQEDEWRNAIVKLMQSNNRDIKLLERKIKCADKKIRTFEIGLTYDTEIIYAFFYDITERKVSEKNLRESETRFRNLAELMLHPVSFVTIKGEFVFLNKQFTKQFGYTLQDFPNIKTVVNNTRVSAAQKKQGISSWEKEVQLLFKTQKPLTNRIEVETKDGDIRLVEYSATLAGNYVYYVYTDITEQKAREEKLTQDLETFKRIAQNTPIAVAGCKASNFELVYSNKKFSEVLGYDFNEIAPYDEWLKLILHTSSEQLEARKKLWIETVQNIVSDTTSKVPILEREIRCKNGEIKTFELGLTHDNDIVYAFFHDITSRKKMELQIKENEERFRTLAENLPVPVISLHANNGLVFANKKHKELMGHNNNNVGSPSQFVKFLKSGNKKDNEKQRYLNIIRLLSENTEPNPVVLPSHEIEILCVDGVWRIFQVSETMYGQMLYAIFHDVTKQREAEKDLKESEARFRNIAENIPIPFVTINTRTNSVYANKKHNELIGYKNSKPSDNTNNIREFSISDLPNQKDKEKYIAVIEQAANNKKPNPIVCEPYKINIVCRDNIERAFEITETIFGNTVYTAFHDITQQQIAHKLLSESEQKFKELAQHVPIAIGAYNDKGQSVFLNDYFTKITGYELKDIATIRMWYKKTQPNVARRQHYFEYWQKMIADYKKGSKLPRPEIKVSCRCKDGRFKNFSFHFSIFGSTTYILLADVTEQERAKKQLEKSYQDLRSLTMYLQKVREDERMNISREIHDELGQQLTGIKMDASAIFKKLYQNVPVNPNEFSQVIQALDLSVKTVRKISTQLRPSILDDLGLEAAVEWQLQEFSKRTNIICNFQNHVNNMVLDAEVESNLFRVVQESLTNIMRHAHATNVLINLQQIEKNIVLSISDDGKGFNPKLPTPTLGLLGMRERIETIKGTFEIVTEKNKGTIIIITIPVK